MHSMRRHPESASPLKPFSASAAADCCICQPTGTIQLAGLPATALTGLFPAGPKHISPELTAAPLALQQGAQAYPTPLDGLKQDSCSPGCHLTQTLSGQRPVVVLDTWQKALLWADMHDYRQPSTQHCGVSYVTSGSEQGLDTWQKALQMVDVGRDTDDTSHLSTCASELCTEGLGGGGVFTEQIEFAGAQQQLTDQVTPRVPASIW